MKIFSIFVIVAGVAITVCLSAYKPEWLGHNSFLYNFISHEVISLLGVVVAITFASVENVHLYLSRIEGEYNEPGKFASTRRQVNRNIHGLVLALVVSIALLMWKGYYNEDSYTVLSFVHGFHLVIIMAYIFVLIDIFGLISDMAPALSKKKDGKNDHS